MRFGCCAGIEHLRAIELAGYDYVELAAEVICPLGDEAAFTAAARQIAGSRMRPEVWNRLVLPQVPLVGPQADERQIDSYLATTLRRIARVGGEVVVFGSGGARRIPDGWPREKAHKQLLEFLNACADYADRYNLIVAIEPLRKAESNVINNYVEAVALASDAQHPRVQALADMYHFDEEQEPYGDIAEDGAWLAHVHVADTLRKAPGAGSGDFAGFFSAVKEAGYDQRVTIECIWDDVVKQAAPSLAFLRQQWADASI